MKNKKLIIILIISIVLIGIFSIIISRNGIVVIEKKIIKEMNESTQVTELNSQITKLNKEHEDYLNYIQTCKTQIATALTNEGVSTSNQITLEEMATNIPKILQARTSDATASAEDIAAGETAWVNGELITGTLSGGSGLTLLKSGQSGNKSIDLSDVLDDTTKYTIDDFLIVVTKCKLVSDAHKDADANQPPSGTATKTLGKTYTPSTGILKTTNYSFTVQETSSHEYGTSWSKAVVTLTYNVYLIN